MRSFNVSAIFVMLAVLIMALAISGCTSPTPTVTPTLEPSVTPTPEPSGPAVLTVDGKVNTPLNLSLSDLKGYTQYNAAWVNTAGNGSYNGTGPKLLDILNKTSLQSGAINVTFFASDSFNNTMTLADLNGKYNDTIVAWEWTGVDRNNVNLTNVNNTLQLIVPGGSTKNQVKLLVQITVS